MFGSNWREEFYSRVEEVESGLSKPSTKTFEVPKIERIRELLPVSLKRIQKTDDDISDYVLAAKKVLVDYFSDESFDIAAEADPKRHPIPEPMRGDEIFMPGEAANYFGTDYSVLGMITDAPLGGNLRGQGSTAGWFVVTLRPPVPSAQEFAEVVLHEFGHVLGLDHCKNPSCLMAQSTIRNSSGRFCEPCTKILRSNAKERTITKKGR